VDFDMLDNVGAEQRLVTLVEEPELTKVAGYVLVQIIDVDHATRTTAVVSI
jgi:hypothetical protein